MQKKKKHYEYIYSRSLVLKMKISNVTKQFLPIGLIPQRKCVRHLLYVFGTYLKIDCYALLTMKSYHYIKSGEL